ncbi:hypothetical protein CNY67_01260 [Desulfovibrio sp. G11]|nr:hypothetical protein CNY67_01260 [Desulfovibrio sp. G11]
MLLQNIAIRCFQRPYRGVPIWALLCHGAESGSSVRQYFAGGEETFASVSPQRLLYAQHAAQAGRSAVHYGLAGQVFTICTQTVKDF